jgi:Na+-transporting methylmalonyl-CoA/oxaloacetate decarboxylase gamma subunit
MLVQMINLNISLLLTVLGMGLVFATGAFPIGSNDPPW